MWVKTMHETKENHKQQKKEKTESEVQPEIDRLFVRGSLTASENRLSRIDNPACRQSRLPLRSETDCSTTAGHIPAYPSCLSRKRAFRKANRTP